MLRRAWNVPRSARFPAAPSVRSDADAVALVAPRCRRWASASRCAGAGRRGRQARPQVALRLGIDEAALAECLARARKELRRTLAPLPGSGWCERAERQISDRMDGALADATRRASTSTCATARAASSTSAAWLQATDALVAGVAAAPSAPAVPLPAAEPSEAKPAASRLAGAGRRPAALAACPPVAWNVLLVIAIVLALACSRSPSPAC